MADKDVFGRGNLGATNAKSAFIQQSYLKTLQNHLEWGESLMEWHQNLHNLPCCKLEGRGRTGEFAKARIGVVEHQNVWYNICKIFSKATRNE